MNDGAAQAASEVVHHRTRLLIAGGGIEEVVGRVQDRAVPQFVEIAVKLVGAGLGDVVDLRRSIAALVHGIGERVDGHLGN